MQVVDAARVGRLVRCANCLHLFPDNEVQVDHVHPEHLGGGHDLDNLQVLCYPKTGPSCHKDKTAEEATARAAARAKANGSGWSFPIRLLIFHAGAYLLWVTYLMYEKRDVAPAVKIQHDIMLGWCATLAAVWILYMILHMKLPIPDKPAPVKTGETPAQRINAAVRAEMGDQGEVRVYPSGQGFKVTYRNTNFADRDDNAKLKVQQRISAKMGGRWRCDWTEDEDFFITQPRPALPSRIDHPGVPDDKPWWLLPIGTETTIDLKVTPHVLCIGATLAGKTSIFRSMVISSAKAAAADEVRLFLFDPKRVELIGFRGWPGISAVLTSDEDMYEAPMMIEKEMYRRAAAVEFDGAKTTDFKPWIVIIDEYREYVKRMGKYSLAEGFRKTVSSAIEPVESIATLLAMARKMNIHLIIGTQRPDAKWFGGDTRDNMQCRIGVGPLSRDAAIMVFGKASIGRDIPLEAKGRFTYQMNDGTYEEDQSYWVSDPTDAEGTNTLDDWRSLVRLGMPREKVPDRVLS